jgi:hypothetical protein
MNPTGTLQAPGEELRRGRWGNWVLDRERLTLEFDNGEAWYEIDLERCASSAAVLNWIAQIRTKVWATSQDVGDLVHAFDDVLGLQQNLCSFGVDTPIADIGAYLRRRLG